MSGLYSFGLPEVIAALIVVALCAYAVTAGADFGRGIWRVLASGPRRVLQRDFIATSFAPAWPGLALLVIVAVLLASVFPVGARVIAKHLHIPILVMLAGIAMRIRRPGSALASMLTPFFFGASIGALASGRVGDASHMITNYLTAYVTPWLSWFPISVGLFALALLAFLGAVQLASTATGELQEDFRRRALVAALAVFFVAAAALIASHRDAMRVAIGITLTPLGIAVQVVTGIAAIAAIWALWTRRYAIARVAAAAQATSIIWGWAFAQFPYVVPETLRIRAEAPRVLEASSISSFEPM